MAYKDESGWFAIFIYIVIGIFIQDKVFPKTNGYLYWALFVLSSVIFFYLLFIIEKLSAKIKKYNEQNKLKNTLCKHGIKGGYTLELCDKCKEEKEKERQRYEAQKREHEEKEIIKQKAIELRNQEIQRYIKINLINKESLYNISANEFEDVVAEMYKKLGYLVKQTPYSNDRGKDIILKIDNKKYLVECKKYNFQYTIGREALQKFFAAIIEENADKGFFITTSDFKSTAVQYAKDIKKIELINGNQLIAIMREVYPDNYSLNIIKAMCKECGDVVEFSLNDGDKEKSCKNGHKVINDFDTKALSLKYLSGDKFCIKCGKPMKLVNWKGKRFWGCSDYPRCRSYQRVIDNN
jgi:HJR/Mrr/RecB family endonuclease